MAGIIPPALYNKLLMVHVATSRAQERNIKSVELGSLASILHVHELDDDLEVHVLHGHFDLEAGEALIHTEIVLGTGETGTPRYTIDIAKAMKYPENAGECLL
jgi:hypothetical protein